MTPEPGASGPHHGRRAPRGLSAPPGPGGRFTSMFPDLERRDPGADAIRVLGDRMHQTINDDRENVSIPAGYTYLGQFIDHDITFDATSKIDRANDPHALVNFRTPRFDLDSLYGAGPGDQSYLYDWDCGSCSGVKLLVGHNPPYAGLAPVDLPRNAQGRATIGDGRNDENLLVSQLHLLFIRFHNSVVEHLREGEKPLAGNALFDEAHRIVRWHYQWIVTHEFLRLIVGDTRWTSLSPRLRAPAGGAAAAPGDALARWKAPTIPVEFSAAAYRFGHSMVRPSYVLNSRHTQPAPIVLLKLKRRNQRHLGGLRPLPSSLQVNWRRFFGTAKGLLSSMPIDHRLAKALFALPPDGASLAALNLRRGRRLGLPAGNDVAEEMREEVLLENDLFPGSFWPRGHMPAEREAVLRSPPLWFYVLRDAFTLGERGKHLGPVGGRIVAEVLIGLLEADPDSYLRGKPGWTPELKCATASDFTMTDLLNFVDDHE